MEKKFDRKYTRMLRAVLNKFWRQHPTKQLLYGHLPPITKLYKLDDPDMQDNAGEVRTNVSDVLQWTPSHARAKSGRPAGTYIQQLWADTGCSLKTSEERWTIKTDVERGSGRTLNWRTLNWIAWIWTVWLNWISWNKKCVWQLN